MAQNLLCLYFMRQYRFLVGFIVAVIVVAAAAYHSFLNTEGTIDEDTIQSVDRSNLLEHEDFATSKN